jgi:biotin carboxylase
MTGSRRIAIIGGTPAAVHKARQAGFEVAWVHHPHEVKQEGLGDVAEAYLVDYREPGAVTELLTTVHRLRPLDRVISMTEDGLESAAVATTALGLPGNGIDVVSVLQDKLAFRARLAERGVDHVAARLGRAEADIRGFVAEFGPTVIKPRYGSGSFGVRLVPDLATVGQVAAWAARFGLHTFVMEQYLAGAELSVESFSFAGRHVILAHTAKEKLASFVEIGHVQPANLSAGLAAQVDHLVMAMLDAVGLANGPAHTEVIITADGPRLVESHSRRGGDRIPDLVKQVYGIDTDALMFRWYAGQAEVTTPGPASGGAAVRFLISEPGIVESVEGTESVLADPQLVDLKIDVAPGDTVAPIEWSYDRSGMLLVRGTDAQDARRRARDLADRITIRTRAVSGTPGNRTAATIVPRPDRLIGAAPGGGSA